MMDKEKFDLGRLKKNMTRHSSLKDMEGSVKRPFGAISFIKSSSTLRTNPSLDIQVFQISSGEQLFRLERKKELILSYYHFSPGTGAREALLDLKKIPPCRDLLIILNWGIENISIFVTPVEFSGGGMTVNGEQIEIKYRVGTNGIIYNIENQGMPHVTVSNKIVLQPTALEVWKETLNAIDILGTGESNEAYHEHVVSNLSIIMIVSGFEVYTKRRFLEIEDEGILPRIDKVISAFFSYKERPQNIVQIIKDEANKESISPLRLMVNKNKINFQSFQQCKRAYSKAYRIPFGNIEVSSDELIKLQKYIKYRHRIIHVHPVFGVLNPEKAGIEEPVISNNELVQEIKKTFELFIEKLHQSTLKLTP